MPLKTVVLDIETVPNEAAIDRLNAMRPDAVESELGWPKWVLQRVVAASALSIEEDLETPTFELSSWHVGDTREAAIIAEVERALEGVHSLVTFNGRAHDLPILRARAMAARALAVPKIAGLRLPKAVRHTDLSEELCGRGSGRPSLAEVAALLNLPAKAVTAGTSVPALAARGEFGRIVQHCETDVITTYLAHLHLAMSDAGSEQWFVSGALGLRDWLHNEEHRRPHLVPYIEAAERMAGLRPADEQPLPDVTGVEF